MPYTVKGKCIFKKDGGAKVGCTKGSVDKYLAALHANADESVELTEENKLVGGKADKLTPADIAKKFKVNVSEVEAQIRKGIKIEMEHTSDKEKATEIATDHVSEFADYYDRLDKMEKEASKDWKVKDINENNLFNITMPDADWAIYRISNGEKCYITRLSHNAGLEVCDYRAKYSDEAVLNFSLAKAKELIKKNISVGDKLGVVNSKGNQQLFDWRIKYEKNDINENTKSLIKRLIRENLKK